MIAIIPISLIWLLSGSEFVTEASTSLPEVSPAQVRPLIETHSSNSPKIDFSKAVLEQERLQAEKFWKEDEGKKDSRDTPRESKEKEVDSEEDKQGENKEKEENKEKKQPKKFRTGIQLNLRNASW